MEWLRLLSKGPSLRDAARKGDCDRIRELLARKIWVDNRSEDGKTALMLAAEGRSHEAVSLLLAAGADPNAKDRWEQTPVHFACSTGDVKLVEMLLWAGGKVYSSVYTDSPLSLACRINSIEMAKLLIEKGAPTYTPERMIPEFRGLSGPMAGVEPLEAVVLFHDNPELASLILAGGLPAESHPSAARALLWAAESGRWLTTEVLIAAGAHRNPHFNAVRPIVHAIKAGRVDVAAALIAHARELDVSAFGYGSIPAQSPLATAAIAGSEELVAKLLEAGADPNAAREGGQTPLMDAVAVGTSDPRCIEILLRGGADANRADGKGLTALFHALLSAPVETFRLLLKHGADPELRAYGTTPLEHLSGAARQHARDAEAKIVALNQVRSRKPAADSPNGGRDLVVGHE